MGSAPATLARLRPSPDEAAALARDLAVLVATLPPLGAGVPSPAVAPSVLRADAPATPGGPVLLAGAAGRCGDEVRVPRVIPRATS